MRRVETRLGDAGPNASRNAHFVCALALAWPDGHVEWFEGRVDGALVWQPRGDKGFGYDPVFLPDGGNQTFGEMEPDANQRSEERRVGNECVSTGRYRGCPNHDKKKIKTILISNI